MTHNFFYFCARQHLIRMAAALYVVLSLMQYTFLFKMDMLCVKLGISTNPLHPGTTHAQDTKLTTSLSQTEYLSGNETPFPSLLQLKHARETFLYLAASNAARLYWSAETPRWRKTIWRESVQLENDKFAEIILVGVR